MKEERFEKVVKWKKEPDWIELIGCIMMLIIFSLIVIALAYAKTVTTFEHIMFVLTSFLLGILMVCIIELFIKNLGKRRKVYWRKIR